MERAEEATILKVEQDGPESCELAHNSSFVLVRVPVRADGEGEKIRAGAYFRMGPFRGVESYWWLEAGAQKILRFRVPLELFRQRERFAVEILTGDPAGPRQVLWTKRWSAIWNGDAPSLEPLED